MADNLEFADIVNVVNCTRTAELATSPSEQQDGSWALYRGHHKVHTSTYPNDVMYLSAHADVAGVEAAYRAFDAARTHVVYPPSLDQRMARHRQLFGAVPDRMWTTNGYLASLIRDELESYLGRLSDIRTPFYVDPSFEAPKHSRRKGGNALMELLGDANEGAKRRGKLGILLAHPGQGKTYVSQTVVRRLAERTSAAVPVLIDSSQWLGMSVGDLRSLSKTIMHSFRHFDAAIVWASGHEDMFVRTMLKADLFRIVFDGFDEYILRNGAEVEPMEVLETLASLAEDTGAHILITSRTNFWHASMEPDAVEAFLRRHSRTTRLYTMLPFDKPAAVSYFKGRLRDRKSVGRAAQVYSDIHRANEDLAGRGFVLSLIADLVERSDGALRFRGQGDIILWLVEALCVRDVKRQQSPLSGREQLRVLEEFAVEVARGVEPGSELLELALSVVRDDLDKSTRARCLDVFKSHSIIELQSGTRDMWVFKQAQTQIALVASAIASGDGEAGGRIAASVSLDPAAQQDLAQMVLDILLDRHRPEEVAERVGRLVPSMCGNGEAGLRLAGLVALATVDRVLVKPSSLQRTEALLGIVGRLEQITLSGTIARYDFRGVCFSSCRFEGVIWAHCVFDENTRFEGCSFLGGGLSQCKGFAEAAFEKCSQDATARAWFEGELIRSGRKRYSTEELKADIAAVLVKFVTRTGVGVHAVPQSDLAKGVIGASKYRDEILEELLRNVLEPDSGVLHGRGVRVRRDAERAVMFYVGNGVFTGPIQRTFESLQRRLSLRD